ncbi:zinc finger protein 205-like isoform X2 [Thrips palmi]|uniref:Zinc finger protein 205-like isoform X2 n=1 Tax=Thrips palmi TaxID=161013 RepID=A0A6P8ZCN1_THRPL|nr:zinc finger protein 205-like isoform X2 [Thrips palmi]
MIRNMKHRAWRVKTEAEECGSPPEGAPRRGGCSAGPGHDDVDGSEAEEPWLHIDATFSLASGVGHAKQDSAASGTAGDGGADRAVASQCAERGAALDAEAGLEKHLAARGKRHACQHCGKDFKWASSLEEHSRTHTGEKPFQCKMCGKKFAFSGALTRHERIHTGEKPFHCEVCGKKFANSSNFVEHARIHTGEKPFHCAACGKKFAQSSHLVAHARRHTGAKPLQC